jgi:hypothetical protein
MPLSQADFQSFRFFDLPLELRRAIYRFALLSPVEIRVRYIDLQDETDAESRSRADLYDYDRRNLDLLETCPVMRSEASPVFYAESIFNFTGLQSLLQWLQQVANNNLRHVRKLALEDSPYWDLLTGEPPGWHLVGLGTQLENQLTNLRQVSISGSLWVHGSAVTIPEEDLVYDYLFLPGFKYSVHEEFQVLDWDSSIIRRVKLVFLKL